MPIQFEPVRCTGCRLCMIVCSAQHEGVCNPNLARLNISTYYDKNGIQIENNVCNLCLNCVEVCLVEAISYNGIHLEIDSASCVNCGVCIEECPEKVIKMVDDRLLICDLCEGSPHCVAWCSHKALTFEEGEK